MFFMIERLLKNRSAVEGVLGDRSVTKSSVARKLEIHEDERKILEDLAETLKPLQLTTTVLCAEGFLPISMV